MSAEDTFSLVCQSLTQSQWSPDSKPVFWLGAGCSRYDGMPTSEELLTLTLPADAGSRWGSRQYQFDRFCEGSLQGNARAGYLGRFFQKELLSDSPYHGLVKVAKAGLTDLICTFNIDSLLEDACNAAGMRVGKDYRVIDAALQRPEAVVDQVATRAGPPIRILKLHGSHETGFNLMTSQEIAAYGPHIASVVEKCSQATAIVCGYSFFHLNVLNAFSRTGGPLYYVNRSFPDAPMVLSLMELRSRGPNFVDGDLGCFEKFMPRVCAQLGL